MNCPRCGKDLGPLGVGTCDCKVRDAFEKKEWEKKQAAMKGPKIVGGAHKPPEPKGPQVRSVTTDQNGNDVLIYDNGARVVKSRGYIKRRFRIALFFVIAIVIAALIGVKYFLFYPDEQREQMPRFEITSESSGDLFAQALKADDNAAGYKIYATENGIGFFRNIINFSSDNATVEYWTENGQGVWSFELADCDLNTGLSGNYYITTIGGKKAIADRNDKKIYPEGSVFYNQNYEKLMALTHDNMLGEIQDALKGGKRGKNDSYGCELLVADKAALCSDGDRLRICDERSGKRILYTVSYYDKTDTKMQDISSFTTDGSTGTGDKLTDLMITGDSSPRIKFLENGEEKANINLNIQNGIYEFEFKLDYNGFEADTDYVVDPEKKTLTVKKWNNEKLTHDETEYKASEKQKEYDYLLSIVPQTFVKANFDFDKAEKSGFLWYESYKIKDENGDTKATLTLWNDKPSSFILKTDDTHNVTISW